MWDNKKDYVLHDLFCTTNFKVARKKSSFNDLPVVYYYPPDLRIQDPEEGFAKCGRFH